MRGPQVTRLPSRIALFSGLIFTIIALCAAACPAADNAEPILEAARTAVSNSRTPALGFTQRTSYTDTLPQGGILIGFECGVGKWAGDIDTVYALRPIYLTRFGESGGQEHGLFSDRREGKRLIKSEVKRTVRVLAKSGYAVGGMTIRSGLNINGLSLTYQKIKGDRLDPFDFQQSAWIGDRTGGSEASISSDGNPIIGIFGSKDERHVSSLGLIYANVPTAAKKPEPPKVEKPIEKPTEPPKVDKAAQPPADAAKPDKAEGTPAPVADTAASEEAKGMNWLPFAIFGLVAVPILVLLLVYSRRQTNPGTLTSLPQQTEGAAAGAARAPAMFEKPPSDALQARPSGPPGNEPQRPWPAAEAPPRSDPLSPWPASGGKSTGEPPAAWPSRSASTDAISPSPTSPAPLKYGGSSYPERGSSYPGLSGQYPGSDGLPPMRRSDSEPPLWDDPYGDPSRPRRRWGKQDYGGETREMAAAKKECAGILFGIAALQMVCGFAVLSLIPDDMFKAAGVDKNTLSWIVMLIGCAFGGLGYWALSQPLIPAILGLVLYGAIFFYELPMMLKGGMPFGIYIRVAIIAALIRGVSSAAKASGTNFK